MLDPDDLPLPLDDDDIKVLLSAAWMRENRPEAEIKVVSNLTAYLWQYTQKDGVELRDVQDLLSLLVEHYTESPVWAFSGYDGDDEILNKGREILVTQMQQIIESEIRNLPAGISHLELQMRTRAVAERLYDIINHR